MDSLSLYRWLADALVLVHLGFVAFVVGGGLLVLRWRRVIWLHLPAAAWGAIIEFTGWICPLTPLEQSWRIQAGSGVYQTDFVARYLLPVLYPDGLTRAVQVALGVAVLAVNIGVYGLVVRRWRRQVAPGSVA